jgi:rubrerythrin
MRSHSRRIGEVVAVSGIDRFEKTTKREIHRCLECDDFELEKRFSGVAGTPGEEEYDRIEAPDQCPVCDGKIEREVKE